MKIGFITKEVSSDTGQGVYVYAYQIYSLLRRKCSIKLISPKDFGGFFKNFFYEQFLLPLQILFSKADVFHAISPEDGCWLPLIKKKSIITFHDILPLTEKERHPLFRIYFWFCSKMASKATKIISSSQFTKTQLINYLKIPEKKIKVIYLGVNTSKFYPLHKKIKHKTFTIGYLGGLGKRKNVSILIKAMSLIKENVRLVIGGEGPEKENLKKLVEKLKLQKKVSFQGHIPDSKMPEFYQNLDLFVFPSQYEGFGIPVIEAMACGIPVITSNTSSLLEIARNAGICIKPGDPLLLSKTILSLIKNKKELNKLSSKSLKRAKKFTWEKCASKILKEYKLLANKK